MKPNYFVLDERDLGMDTTLRWTGQKRVVWYVGGVQKGKDTR